MKQERFGIKIGPATIRRGVSCQIKTEIRQLKPLEDTDELDEVVVNINHPIANERAREYMQCATCLAAKRIDSTPEEELKISATKENGDTLALDVGCVSLQYAFKNGFPQEAEYMKAKKPFYLVVGVEK